MGSNNSSERVKRELKEDISEHQFSVADIEAKERKSIKSVSKDNE